MDVKNGGVDVYGRVLELYDPPKRKFNSRH